MVDKTSEEALKIIESIGASYCNECVKHDICNKCEINKAYTIIHQDIKKLSAYESADLIEREKAIKKIDEELKDGEFNKDYINAIDDYNNLLEDIPRFKPMKEAK